ncbi:MAG: hypothetical protein HZA46_24415 [Planctomycetales bacterium]|nr:hypothetical protein [Planctomycetales bacterium]
MTHREQLAQRIAWLLTDDHVATTDAAIALPSLELVPLPPHADWHWLPGFVTSAPATDWLPRVVSDIDEIALRAGLLLLHDFIEESHEQSQRIEGKGEYQLGDYWHAILHRREPDFANAKYWFRQIGHQSVFDELGCRADAILRSCASHQADRWRTKLGCPTDWNPFAFVDLCQSCESGDDSDLTTAARQIQFAEMLLLFRQTHGQATGI